MRVDLELEESSRVLVAGAGGGYDVVCALPVALSLRRQGHTVHLASYSAMNLEELGKTISPLDRLYAVTRDSVSPPNTYNPEGYLAAWWHQEFGEEITVWTYTKVGVLPLSRILAHLAVELKLNAVIVVDAGVDALFDPIWISPFTLLYWFFHLDRVLDSKPFADEGLKTEIALEMFELIQRTRDRSYILPRTDIPI